MKEDMMDKLKDMKDFLNTLTELPVIGFYAPWEFDMLQVYFDPSERKFYWVHVSGCCCNDYLDDVSSLDEFSVGDDVAFLKAVEEFDGGKWLKDAETSMWGL